jgi:hypothetical protein
MVKKKIIFSLIIFSLAVLGGGVIFLVYHRPKSPAEKNNSPQPSHSSLQKILARQIKEDLQKDLVKAQKGEKNKNGYYDCGWLKTLGESCSEYRGNEWRFWYHGETETTAGKEKAKKRYVFHEELETDDWKKTEGLIQQIKKLEKEEEERKNQKFREEQAQIDQKLNSNPEMFCYEDKQE